MIKKYAQMPLAESKDAGLDFLISLENTTIPDLKISFT